MSFKINFIFVGKYLLKTNNLNMKRISTLFLFFFYFQIFQAQTLTFVDAADMPAAKSAISSANDGSNIYVTNGFSLAGGYTSDVFKLDTNTNTWSVLTNSTIAKRFGSAEIVGNNLYVFNGFVANNTYNDALEVVDLTTGSVSNTGLVNPQPAAVAGVAKQGNIIYSFGGNTASGYSNKLYAFNTTSLVATELATMPIAAETKGEIVNGKLYVIGGFNGSVSDKIYVYDIATNIWTNEYDLPQGLSANATAVIGNNIYVAGDFSNQTFTGFFDTTTNTFTETTSNLLNRRHAAAEGINNDLFVMGGNTSSSGTSAIASVQATTITLGINGNEQEKLLVYPNPTSGLIHFPRIIEQVTLLNVFGTIIKASKNANDIDLQDVEDGIYFLKLESHTNMQCVKIIKQ